MDDFNTQFNTAINQYADTNQYGVSKIPYHTHNGVDSPLVEGRPNWYLLTDSATVTLDLRAGDIQSLTLGGNRTLQIQNAVPGDVFTVRLIQDATGTRTVTWFSTIKWPAGTIPTLTTTANKTDVFGFICTGASTFDGFIIGQNL